MSDSIFTFQSKISFKETFQCKLSILTEKCGLTFRSEWWSTNSSVNLIDKKSLLSYNGLSHGDLTRIHNENFGNREVFSNSHFKLLKYSSWYLKVLNIEKITSISSIYIYQHSHINSVNALVNSVKRRRQCKSLLTQERWYRFLFDDDYTRL